MSFIPEGKGIGYAERQVSILEGKGIGTVHAAYVLEYAFRIHDGYKGHGANEMRTSEILTPEDPEGAERKHRLILRVGYLPDGERPKELPDGRYVKPYKMTRERYEEVRPTLLPLLAFAKDRIMP